MPDQNKHYPDLNDMLDKLLKEFRWTQRVLAGEINENESNISRARKGRIAEKVKLRIVRKVIEHLETKLQPNEIEWFRQYKAWCQDHVDGMTSESWEEHCQRAQGKAQESEHTLFVQEVERIIRAKGFKVERIATEEIDIIATKYGPFGLRIIISLESQERLVEKDKVVNLYKQLSKFGANVGQFIARQGFTLDAWKYAQEPERAIVLRLLTYQNLITESVDFRPYLDYLIKTWKQSKISQHQLYVNLSGTDEQGQVYHSLNVQLLHYLESDNQKVALLGDFGMGKTTFCRYFSYELARHSKEQHIKSRIPILVDLKEYESVRDIYQLVLHTLQHNGVPDITLELLEELLHHGRFIFIYDGFDEMSFNLSRIAVQQNLRILERIVESGANRLIITCRTHFFKNSVEEPERLRYMHIYLTAWRDEEIQEYLRRAVGKMWSEVMEKIAVTYDLRELASTPLFLDMIVTSIDQLHGKVNASRLYEVYTSRWIEKQDYRSVVDRHQKETFIAELAWYMLSLGKHKIHSSELTEWIHTVLDSTITEDIRLFDNDIRTCSFLNRDKEGNYQFMHKSFMEFFVAKKLFQEISQGSSKNLEKMHMPYEVDQFIKDFLITEPSAISHLIYWMKNSNSVVLRANSTGELAKLDNSELNKEVINTLGTDAAVREGWLPPLLRRVLKEDKLISIGYKILADPDIVQRDPTWTGKDIQEIANRFIGQLFNERDIASRWFSTRALSSVVLKSEQVISALQKAASADPDPGIRSACSRALERISDETITSARAERFNIKREEQKNRSRPSNKQTK